VIYLDSSALLRFVKPEQESQALRTWRTGLEADIELVTSQLAALEISRTLLRAGVSHDRVPYVVGQALRGLYLVDVTSTVLARARAYGIRRLGSLDAIHLATADPFLPELTHLVTYDVELAAASAELGIAVIAPGR
jgi:predicted nucleic acid-binding protein